MSTKVIIGLNIVFSIIVLVLWQRYSDVISRWETDHAIQVTAIAQQQMTATAQFKVVMATGTVEAKAAAATATAAAQKLTNLAEEQQDTEQQYQHTEQKYQETLAQKLGAEAALRLNDEPDPTLGTLLAAESVRRYQAVEGDVALRRGIELLAWKPIFEAKVDDCIRNYLFDPQGEWITMASVSCRYQESIGHVIQWQVNTGQPVITLTRSNLPSRVVQSTLSRDGQQFIVNDSYKELDRIDIKTGKVVFTISITGDWDFSHDEQKLALAQPDKHTVNVLDVTTRQVLYQVTHGQEVRQVNFSPSGQWLVTSDISGTVWLWDAQTGQSVKNFPHEREENEQLFLTKNEQMIGILNVKQGLELWDVATTQPLTPTIFKTAIDWQWDISPDGQWLATVDERWEFVRIWATATGQEVTRLAISVNKKLRPVTFSPDGQWLVIGQDYGVTRIWQTGTWQEIARPFAKGVDKATFSADGKRLALISSSRDSENFSRLSVWEKQDILATPLFSVSGKVDSIELSHDNQFLIIYYNHNSKWWDLVANKEITPTDSDYYNGLAHNSDGTLVAINLLPGIKATNQTMATVDVSMLQGVKDAKFSPDGQILAVASGEGLILWNVSTRQEITRFITTTNNYNNLNFSPNGQILASATYTGLVEIWDMANYKKLRELDKQTNYSLNKMSFSSDGQWLITSISAIGPEWSLVGGTQIWEVATGRQILNNDEANDSIAFSPNGQWLMTNGGHIWEIATGREVARLGDLMGKATAFSPNNRYILSAENGTVNQWPWQAADMVAVACQRLSRNLTKAEWQQYLGDEPYRKTCPNLEEK